MRHYLLLSTLFLLLTACTDTEDPITPIIEFDEAINFQRPVVGQKNFYDSYTLRCGGEEVSPPSVLTLAVTAVTDDMIELTETTADSNTAPVILHAERVPGNLIISAEERVNSRLLFFYGSDSIRLNAPPVANLEYRDCVFYDGEQVFTGDYVAAIDNFTFGTRTLTNLKTVSCVPVVLDLDAYLLYNENNLMASVQSWRGFGNDSTTEIYLLQTP